MIMMIIIKVKNNKTKDYFKKIMKMLFITYIAFSLAG